MLRKSLITIFRTRSRRALILFALPIYITLAIFISLTLSTFSVFTVGSKSTSPSQEISKEQNHFAKTIDDWAQMTKIPLSLLSFNVYAQNSFQINMIFGNKLKTFMNVDVLGAYTGRIETGRIQKVYSNIKITELPQSYLTSFDLATSMSAFLMSTKQDGFDRYAYFFIWPTLSSVFFLWLSITAIFFALLVTVTSWIKFIYLGSPLSDVLPEIAPLPSKKRVATRTQKKPIKSGSNHE